MSDKETNPEVLKAEMAQKAEQEKLIACSAEIEKTLAEHGFALQPHLSYSEYGVVPRVRLVVNETPNVEQGTDNTEVTDSQQTEGATDTEQS